MAIDYPREYFGWSASSPADYADPEAGLVIHYNGGPTYLDTHAECVSYWKGVRTSHVSGNGWADIGYSFGIDVLGAIFEGRGLHRYQAAQGTTHGNANYYSVSLMIGGNEEPTAAQIEGVKRLRAWLMDQHNVSGTVKGHRDFVSTSCPGTPLYTMVQDGTFTGTPSTYEPLLQRGDTGPAVVEWQEDLLSVDVPLPQWGADGDFGAETEGATEDFQWWRGITVDGVVGPQTREEMADAQDAGDTYPGGSAPAPSTTTAPAYPLISTEWYGPESPNPRNHSGYWSRDRKHIRRIRDRLRERGWSVAKGDRYDAKLAAVIRQFQAEKRLAAVDGLTGPETWRALWTAPIT